MSTRNLRRWVLVVSQSVVIASAGCQTMTNRLARDSGQRTNGANQTTQTGIAKTDFHKEISRDQQFNVHVELAKFHESQGNNEAALAEYEQALAIAESRASILSNSNLGPRAISLAHRRMAATYDRMGRFALSETHYGKALKLTPNDPKVWNDAGYSFYLQNRLADAERTLKTARSFAPDDARILTNLGLTQAMAGKIDEALATLGQAGGSAVGHANLGFILAASGRNAEARKAYQTALTLQPELSQARQALTRLDRQPSDGTLARNDDRNGKTRETPGSIDASVAPTSTSSSNTQGNGLIPPSEPMTANVTEASSPAANDPASATTPSPERSSKTTSWMEPADSTKTPSSTSTPPATSPAGGVRSTGLTPTPATTVTTLENEPAAVVAPIGPNPSVASAPVAPALPLAAGEVSGTTASSSSQPLTSAEPAAGSADASGKAIPLTVVGDIDASVGVKPSTPAAETTPRAEPVADAGPLPSAASPAPPDLGQETTPPQAPTLAENPTEAPAPTPAEETPEPTETPARVAAADTQAQAEAPAPTAPMSLAPTASAPTASAPPSASPQTSASSDLKDPFPSGLNELIAKSKAPQASPQAKPASILANLPSLPPEDEEPPAAPRKSAPAPASTISPRSDGMFSNARTEPTGGALSSNPEPSLPVQTTLASSQDPESAGGNRALGANPAPAAAPRNQADFPVAASRRVNSAPPTLPSKSTPAVVPGWSVPKNYRSATYPPTPSDLTTRAPRKNTPTAPSANMVPPTPW